MAALKSGLVLSVAIGLLGTQGPAVTAQHPSSSTTALRVFEERAADYMTLRTRLERELPPLEPSLSIDVIFARRADLASAIKRARPNARQGGIFTADVARVFRRLIARALEGIDAEALLAELYAEDPAPFNFHLHVNDRFPGWATREMPPILLERLPELPAGLRYQLIDHDLVLWDPDADLIVDFVPDAIARPVERPRQASVPANGDESAMSSTGE